MSTAPEPETIVGSINQEPLTSSGSAPKQAETIKLSTDRLNFHYGSYKALHDISLNFYANKITALIGPSGCGKSTFLRTLNRISETIRHTRIDGRITLDGEDVLALDVTNLRRRVGMVFQRPNPFPKSIFDNVAYGVRVNGLARGTSVREVVEKSLHRAALWDEVKDKLHETAHALSGGQQQRLCIARALAVDPEVLFLFFHKRLCGPLANSRFHQPAGPATPSRQPARSRLSPRRHRHPTRRRSLGCSLIAPRPNDNVRLVLSMIPSGKNLNSA